MIKVEDASHVSLRAPDLDKMQRFLTDFGLSTWREGNYLYGRGLGRAPYVHITEQGEPGFVAMGLRARSLADLQELSRSEGVEIRALERPGGGSAVSLRDPDGYAVEVVADQSPPDALRLPIPQEWNNAHGQRRIR